MVPLCLVNSISILSSTPEVRTKLPRTQMPGIAAKPGVLIVHLHMSYHICYTTLIANVDISGREVLRSASLFQPWLRKLHAFLQNKQGYSFKKMTKRSVQFRYKDKVDVDLLVSPYWSNKDEFYMFLRDEVPRDRRDE